MALPLDRLTNFPALEDITPACLAAAIKRAASGKSAGADGWTYAELKRLPLELVEQLCPVCLLVEKNREVDNIAQHLLGGLVA